MYIHPFKYNNPCTHIIVNSGAWATSIRYLEIVLWCKERFGEGNFSVDFEDYGQHGDWYFRSNSEEDYLLFKIVWMGK